MAAGRLVRKVVDHSLNPGILPSPAGSSATIWETTAYHLMWSAGAVSETSLPRL